MRTWMAVAGAALLGALGWAPRAQAAAAHGWDAATAHRRAFAQDPPVREAPARIDGRVTDRDTGEAVAGATVELAPWSGEAGAGAGSDSIGGAAGDSARPVPPGERENGDRFRAVSATNGAGVFRFTGIEPGEYRLTISHVAYGSFAERVAVQSGELAALRVTLSPTAIELEPVTVSVARAEQRRDRALGTSVRRLTAEQLAPMSRAGDHLANALARLLPGVRARSGRSQSGELVCIEFRNPASLAAEGCRAPVVIVDNVRQANALITLNTLPVANVRSVQAIGPGEAGVRFGADSSYGAIVIETFAAGPGNRFGVATGGPGGALPAGPLSDSAEPLSSGTYSWALEPDPYPWAKALGLAVAANAAGLAAGYAVARSCLGFDSLSQHFAQARCGLAGNAGARLALYAGPQIAVGHLARRFGATDISSGSSWKNAVAGAVMAAPGIVLAVSSDDDGFPASTEIGIFMSLAAAPVAAVLADRLFRQIRP